MISHSDAVRQIEAAFSALSDEQFGRLVTYVVEGKEFACGGDASYYFQNGSSSSGAVSFFASSG